MKEGVSAPEWIDATRFQSRPSPFDAALAYALCVASFWMSPLWSMSQRQINIKI